MLSTKINAILFARPTITRSILMETFVSIIQYVEMLLWKILNSVMMETQMITMDALLPALSKYFVGMEFNRLDRTAMMEIQLIKMDAHRNVLHK